MADDTSRIPGHEQDFEVRIEFKQLIGKISTIHFRHNHIGNNQMNVSRVVPGQAQGFSWRICRHDLITEGFEHFLTQCGDHLIVVHQ